MAGDWIKMRVWLRKDPRVASIADYLACSRPFMDWVTDPVRVHCHSSVYEHITSDVTRAITVNSLLEVWGVSRELGDRENDDLVVRHCDLVKLDDICGTPDFGEAMESVQWVTEETRVDEKGRQYQCVRFPKFFRENESPDDRYRKQHAEAQARYRQKVTSPVMSPSDVTVTKRREEKRRDKDIPPSSSGDDGFAAFWSSYPRRVGKQDALKAWRKLKPDAALCERISGSVQRWRETPDWRKDGGAFVPHPATWLNGRRWEDELPAAVVALKRVAL